MILYHFCLIILSTSTSSLWSSSLILARKYPTFSPFCNCPLTCKKYLRCMYFSYKRSHKKNYPVVYCFGKILSIFFWHPVKIKLWTSINCFRRLTKFTVFFVENPSICNLLPNVETEELSLSRIYPMRDRPLLCIKTPL